MLKPLLLAGLAAAVLAPSLATAQSAGQYQCHNTNGSGRTVGTILGIGIGALLGNAIGEHGGKEGGTILGGIGGGIAGNQIGKSADNNNCRSNQYGAYDRDGRWIPNTSTSYGYYDANGRWVNNGQSGYGPQTNYAPNASGAAAPYDGGRDYRARGQWAPGPQDMAAREDWLDQSIHRRMADGRLSPDDARRALRELRDIRREDANARDEDNRLDADQQAALEHRLDRLADHVGADNRPRDYGQAGD